MLGVGFGPEGVPGKTESGAFEGGFGCEELGVASFVVGGGLVLLGEGVVVPGVDAVDCVEGVDGVADCAAEGAYCVLVLTFGDYAGGNELCVCICGEGV